MKAKTYPCAAGCRYNTVRYNIKYSATETEANINQYFKSQRTTHTLWARYELYSVINIDKRDRNLIIHVVMDGLIITVSAEAFALKMYDRILRIIVANRVLTTTL